MQEATTSPSWLHFAYALIAAFLSGGGIYKLYNIWLNRKKPAAEVGESEARIEKTRAEARRIHVESDSEISNAVTRMTVRISEIQEKAMSEREELFDELEKKRIELGLADLQLRKMKALLDIHGIRYSEFDEHDSD